MTKQEFKECLSCRHFFQRKQVCRDTMTHDKVYSKEKQMMTCSRYAPYR